MVAPGFKPRPARSLLQTCRTSRDGSDALSVVEKRLLVTNGRGCTSLHPHCPRRVRHKTKANDGTPPVTLMVKTPTPPPQAQISHRLSDTESPHRQIPKHSHDLTEYTWSILTSDPTAAVAARALWTTDPKTAHLPSRFCTKVSQHLCVHLMYICTCMYI